MDCEDCEARKISNGWRERRWRGANPWRGRSRGAAAPASVRALDDISDEVCRVVDVAEVCTHAPVETSGGGGGAGVRGFAGVRRVSERGCRFVRDAARAPEADGASLSEEGVRVALTLQEDFERGGIHLDADARRGFDAVLSRSLELGMEFQRNLCARISSGASI